FIERSWTADFADPEFWNPKIMAPNCFNPPAARSVLPQYIERTKWIVAGPDRAPPVERSRAPFAKHAIVPHGHTAISGAGLEESPVFGAEATDVEPTVLFVPVRRWSDGSPGPAATDHRH